MKRDTIYNAMLLTKSAAGFMANALCAHDAEDYGLRDQMIGLAEIQARNANAVIAAMIPTFAQKEIAA